MAIDNITPRMIEIPLTKGYMAIVDEQDSDLACFKWQASVSHGSIHARRDIWPDGNRLQLWLHRVVFERFTGYKLAKVDKVDHIDGNGLNNTRENLRLASNTQNLQNQKISSRNTSGYKGVSWENRHNYWRATIKFEGKTIHIGQFETALEAHNAYKKAALELFGEFARFE